MKKKQLDKKDIIRYMKLAAIFFLLLLLFKGVFILVLLIALSFSMSFIVNTLNLRTIGLELVTFIAVISGVKYGPWIAMAIGFVLISYHMLAGGFFATYLLWVIPAYSLVGMFAGFFPGIEISQLGINLTIAVNINNALWTAITSPAYLPRYLIFVATNIVFNIVLFTILAKPVLLLMI